LQPYKELAAVAFLAKKLTEYHSWQKTAMPAKFGLADAEQQQQTATHTSAYKHARMVDSV
jgi:hypothetical protein